MPISLDLETFSLRDAERITITEEQPSGGRWLAIMARSVDMPPGPRQAVRTEDGAPVEQAAIVAAEWSDDCQAWQWCHISHPSKERIGDLLFDAGAEQDRWYFLTIEDMKTGKTSREVELEDLLTSARAIAERKGADTHWERFSQRLAQAGIGSVTAKTFKILPSDLETPEN